MQELKELIKLRWITKENRRLNDIQEGFNTGLIAALEHIEDLLEKEKEQIADAFRNGSTSSMLGGGHWTQYYNQTYNQNK